MRKGEAGACPKIGPGCCGPILLLRCWVGLGSRRISMVTWCDVAQLWPYRQEIIRA